jgi:hypothetical protein
MVFASLWFKVNRRFLVIILRLPETFFSGNSYQLTYPYFFRKNRSILQNLDLRDFRDSLELRYGTDF